MISYEAALGLSLATVLLMAGTLTTSGIVASQDGVVNWHIVSTGFIPFVIFLISMTAELNRPPFDLVEAEQELVGGFNTEYSSIRFALFFLAEFMNVITMSAVMVTLFLGGPQPLNLGSVELGPIVEDGNIFAWAGPFSGTIWVVVKVLAFLYAYVWFRATLPRLRYDQLMDLGWKLLDPGRTRLVPRAGRAATRTRRVRRPRARCCSPARIAIVVLFVAYGLFNAALAVSKRNREREGAAY